MKKNTLSSIMLGSLLVCFMAVNSPAQGTAFNYNGRLTDGDAAANGNYDITSTIYAAAFHGIAASQSVTNLAVGVTNGLFGVSLN
jgi:hypothetical protein